MNCVFVDNGNLMFFVTTMGQVIQKDCFITATEIALQQTCYVWECTKPKLLKMFAEEGIKDTKNDTRASPNKVAKLGNRPTLSIGQKLLHPSCLPECQHDARRIILHYYHIADIVQYCHHRIADIELPTSYCRHRTVLPTLHCIIASSFCTT